MFRKSRYFKAYQRAFALFEIFRSLAFYNFLNIVSYLPVSSPVCLSLLIFLNKYIPLRVIVIFTVINSVMLKLPEKVFAKHHSTPCLTWKNSHYQNSWPRTQRRCQEPRKHLIWRNSRQYLTIKRRYCCKVLHLRSLRRSWLSLWDLSIILKWIFQGSKWDFIIST